MRPGTDSTWRISIQGTFIVAAVLASQVALAEPGHRPQVAPPELTLPVPTAQEQREENRDSVTTVQFSPSGRFVAMGMNSGSLVVIDLSEGRLAWARDAHQKPLKQVVFARSDQHLISGADDLQVRYWDTATGMMRLKFQGAPLRSLYEIAISPDAHFAAARGFDGFGVLWDLRADKKVVDLFSYLFAFDAEGRFLATAPRRRPGAQLIRLANASKPIQILPDQQVSCLATAPAGDVVALAAQAPGQPSSLILFEGNTGRDVWQVNIPDGDMTVGISSLCFAEDGKQILIGCTNGRLVCLEINTGRLLGTYRFLGSVAVEQIRVVGRDEKRIIARGRGDDFEVESRCWEPGEAEPVWTRSGAVSAAADGSLAARITSEGDMELMDAEQGRRLLRLRGYLRGTRWLKIEN